MEVKEYLKQARVLDLEIKNLKGEIEYLRDLITSIPSYSLTEYVDKSRCVDATFEKAILQIDEIEKKNAIKIAELIKLREDIKMVINDVDDVEERMILFKRYICNETWETIGRELSYDEKTIRRKHLKACERIEKTVSNKSLEGGV